MHIFFWARGITVYRSCNKKLSGLEKKIIFSESYISKINGNPFRLLFLQQKTFFRLLENVFSDPAVLNSAGSAIQLEAHKFSVVFLPRWFLFEILWKSWFNLLKCLWIWLFRFVFLQKNLRCRVWFTNNRVG